MLCVLAAPGSVSAAALLYGQGVLWRIEGHGYEASYLFGTLHSTDERVLRIPDPVLKAFDASRRYIFELVIPPDGGAWASIPRLELPSNMRLRQLIGDTAYNKVVVAAGRYGIPTGQIEKLHPAALFSIFDQPASEWLRRNAGWAFLDQALQNEARSLGKAVYALETVSEQIAVDDGFQRPDLPTLVITMIDQSFKREQEREILIQYYLARNLDAIFDHREGQAALLPPAERRAVKEFMRRLLDVRNHRMAKRAERHLAAGRAFIAVGAAHLPGKNGVLHLLEQRGYKVTRLY